MRVVEIVAVLSLFFGDYWDPSHRESKLYILTHH